MNVSLTPELEELVNEKVQFIVSSERRVGLSERPYSNPARVWPTASCLKVVLIWIGGTTAPVVGSGSQPAWTTLVSKSSVMPSDKAPGERQQAGGQGDFQRIPDHEPPEACLQRHEQGHSH